LNLGHRIEPLLRADQHPASDERHVGVPCEVGSGAKVPVELYQPNGIVLAAQLSEAALIRCVVDHDDLEDAS